MSHSAITEYVAAAWPWLALLLLFQSAAGLCGWSVRGWWRLTAIGAFALAVLAIPIQGMPVARWVAGINTNFSITWTGMLAVMVWERATARSLFSQREWMAAWSVGALAGLVLYPLALGFGSVDPYEWGWHFSPLFVVIGALTGWLIWSRNYVGVLLLCAAIAFSLRLLESANYWDYIVDPVYCLVSFAVLGSRLAVSMSTSLTKRFS